MGGSDSNDFVFGSSTPAQDNNWGAVTVSGAGSTRSRFYLPLTRTDLTFNIHADGTVSASDGGTNTLGNVANVTSDRGRLGQEQLCLRRQALLWGRHKRRLGRDNTIDYSAYTTGVTVNLHDGHRHRHDGVSNIQNITGGAGDDTLTASATGTDVIVGGGGDDTITAGGGADTLSDGGGNDTFKFSDNWGTGTTVTNTGATGTQTLDFSGVTSSLTITLNTDGTVSVSDAPTLGDTLTNVANMQAVVGGTGANTFFFQNQASFDGTLDRHGHEQYPRLFRLRVGCRGQPLTPLSPPLRARTA